MITIVFFGYNQLTKNKAVEKLPEIQNQRNTHFWQTVAFDRTIDLYHLDFAHSNPRDVLNGFLGVILSTSLEKFFNFEFF